MVFREYLLMKPPKSSRRAALAIGYSTKRAKNWCADFHWRARVAAYENAKTEAAVNSILDSMAAHQATVIMDSLKDYAILLEDFRSWYTENKDSFGADDYGKAITARLRIDDMGRRTTGLNNKLGTGNANKANEKPELKPKALTWGGQTVEDDEGEPAE